MIQHSFPTRRSSELLEVLFEGDHVEAASSLPRVSTFANELVKDIIKDQSANVRDFVTSLIQELCQRYRPEILGEVHARVAQGGLDLTGHGVKLDLKRLDTGAVVASLDIPIALRIGKGTVRKMRQNLGWAIGYNAIALPIAAGVFEPAFGLVLRPEIAALSMSGSSVIVAVNALALKRLRLPHVESPGVAPETTVQVGQSAN